jgi:CIC family chloride channel protein
MFILRRIEKLLKWLHTRLNHRQFIILSAVLIGVSAGMAAIILKSSVHFLHDFIVSDVFSGYNILFYFISPAIGIGLCVWYVKRFHGGVYPRGISSVLYALAQKSGNILPHHMYSNIITSSLTVGLGGSAGLESPIVKTGAAFGSNYARTYRLTYKDRTLMIACGSAAGIAAAFNAPIAGVLFALEVLLSDIAISAFVPLLMASASGAILSIVLQNRDVLLTMEGLPKFNYKHLPFYILLGVLCGFFSLYYSVVFLKTEKFFRKFTNKKILFTIYSGFFLGAIYIIFTPLMGEGYEFIKNLWYGVPESSLNNLLEISVSSKIIIFILIGAILFLKPLVVGISIGSGGNGGNFAPSLFSGACLGYLFSNLMNLLSDAIFLPVVCFSIVGMAGILTGIFYAPLTAIFLIAEITGGYNLMIPLMVVSSLSYGIVRYFEPYSMDARRLAEKGKIFTTDKDKNILTLLQSSRFIENDFEVLHRNTVLKDFLDVVSKSRRNIFPVLEDERLLGIVNLNDVRHIITHPTDYPDFKLDNVMKKDFIYVELDEDMQEVMRKFDESGLWNIPVLDKGKYVGFISKSGIFNAYREMMGKMTAE